MKQYKSFIIILAIAILSTLVTTTVLAEENEISTINSNSETTEEVCLDAGVAFVLSNATDELEYIEIEEEEYEEEYCPSSTNGDYSPSCPWNAPGMSIKDFI